MKKVLIFFIVLSIFNCGSRKTRFAFFAATESKLNALQQKWFQPKIFKYLKHPIEFNQKQTLWVYYKPVNFSYDNLYALSLSKKSLGWNEIDLKNKKISPDINALIDSYRNLPPGEYQLRIAFDNKVLDRIQFTVRAEINEDAINYDAPLKISQKNEEDEIIRLSAK